MKRLYRICALIFFLAGSSAEADLWERPGSARDFLSMPPLPPMDLAGIQVCGTAILEIHYVNGAITQMDILETSGDLNVDREIKYNVKRTFRLRPGVSGFVELPLQLDGDFIRTPSIKFPPNQRGKFIIVNDTALLVVDYRNGKVVSVEVMLSTGDKELDRLLAAHILRYYEVRKGRSGKAAVPIRFKLTTIGTLRP